MAVKSFARSCGTHKFMSGTHKNSNRLARKPQQIINLLQRRGVTPRPTPRIRTVGRQPKDPVDTVYAQYRTLSQTHLTRTWTTLRSPLHAAATSFQIRRLSGLTLTGCEMFHPFGVAAERHRKLNSLSRNPIN